MKLTPSLSNLLFRCQTICVPECCGKDAYDFSPIHIASFLTQWTGMADEKEVKAILDELTALKRNHGSQSPGAKGVSIQEMNQYLTAPQVDDLVREITENFPIALGLIQRSEALRSRPA